MHVYCLKSNYLVVIDRPPLNHAVIQQLRERTSSLFSNTSVLGMISMGIEVLVSCTSELRLECSDSLETGGGGGVIIVFVLLLLNKLPLSLHTHTRGRTYAHTRTHNKILFYFSQTFRNRCSKTSTREGINVQIGFNQVISKLNIVV